MYYSENRIYAFAERFGLCAEVGIRGRGYDVCLPYSRGCKLILEGLERVDVRKRDPELLRGIFQKS